MISGRVSAKLDPLVTIEIRDAQGGLQPVEVVVDTGFSGELALPSDLVRSLGLHYIDDIPVFLADQQQRSVRAYEGVLSWHGRHREAVVLEMGSEPLLGMALMLESILTVSCRPNGPVVIEEEEL